MYIMIKSLNKLSLILTATLTLIILSLITPSVTSAQSLIFQDDFNDNFLDTNIWQIKEFNHTRFGSFSDLGQLNVFETNQELQIIGNDYIPDIYYPEYNTYYGWFGKSIMTNQSYSLNNIITLKTKIKILSADIGYQSFLTLEFNSQNRIVLAIGNSKYDNQLYWPIATLLVFEENGGAIRCVGNSLEEENQTGCIFNNINLQLNKTYLLEIRFDPTTRHVFGYLDGELVHAGTFQGNISDFHVGIAAAVRDTGNYIHARFDDFKLYSGTSETTLEVPDLKQFTPQWANLEYDYASSWYPTNPTISRWGCALTSASMLLKYYGHDINPDALNEWLNAQKDGYNRNGGIIWPTVSRLTEYRWLANHDWPILEFSYLNYSEDTLKNEIQNNRPGILKLLNPIYDSFGNIKSYASHFLVGKGFNDTDILINDPGSNSHTTLAQANSYWGSTNKIGKFEISETDLSYIVLYVDDGFDIKVSDENGEIRDEAYYFQEYPMSDPANPDEESGVETLNAFYYPKPASEEYAVEIKGDGIYRLDYYIYDDEGNVQVGNSLGEIQENQSDEYTINFNKYDVENSFVPQITLESVISYWEEMENASYIENKGLYTSINRLLENAYKISDRNKEAAKSLLNEILYILDNPDSEPENNDVLSFLRFQVEELISSLQ